MRMALKDRIREVVEAGYSQAQLAKAAGKTPAAVTFWLDGNSKSIKADSAAGIQSLTGFSAVWIATGKGPKKIPAAEEGPHIGPTIGGSVPLISNVQAGSYKEHVDNLHPGDGGLELIPTTVPVNRHTFALRVSGDSMEPEFTDGMILIIEPELEANPGDYVVAKNGDDETTFKQLTKDGGDWYLKPMNPRYPIKTLGDSRIIGVLRAVEKRYR
jgi:SOS-response transcriptional repressor LexA